MSQTPQEPRAQSATLAPAQFGRAQPVLPPPPWEAAPPASSSPDCAGVPAHAPSGDGQPILPPPPSGPYDTRGLSSGQAHAPESVGIIPPSLYNQQGFQVLALGGTVVPLPAQDASALGSQNYLGVLSLVAPFVGFSLFGIVFGHLALKAIKAGRANNNGIALAGTVISWVFTSLATLGVLGFIAIIMFAPTHDAAQDAAVQSNLKALQMAASAYEADNPQAPTLTFANHQYYLGTSVVSAEPSVTAARFSAEGPGAFCIEVDYGDSFVESIDNWGHFSSGC